MCKRVYPKPAPKRKTVRHTAHCPILPMLPNFRAHVLICCHDCHLFLAYYERADVNGKDSEVRVPANFCACGMSDADLLAILETDNAEVAARGYALLLDRIGAAVRLADGHPSDVKQAMVLANDPQMRRLWRGLIRSILAERSERVVSKFKHKIDMNAYHVEGVNIADCIIRKLTQEAA